MKRPDLVTVSIATTMLTILISFPALIASLIWPAFKASVLDTVWVNVILVAGAATIIVNGIVIIRRAKEKRA